MNSKPRDSGAMQLMARIRRAIDRGADAAESIHKQVAKLPLAPFEGVEPLEGALKDVRRMQERAIGAIYDLVRDESITGFAVVAGDRHSFWAGLMAKALPPKAFEPVGVEFITGSISAQGAMHDGRRSAHCALGT